MLLHQVDRPPSLRQRLRALPRQWFVVGGLVLLVTTIATAWAAQAYRPQLRRIAYDWMSDYGYLGQLDDRGVSAVLRFPAGWLRGLAPDTVPSIHLDVKFKHMQRLWSKRKEAMELGVLVQSLGDLVPAMISVGDRTVRAKIRLKGDWTVDLKEDWWAFRVHIRGGDHLLGMRRFSFHNPKARDYQGEALFHAMMRHEGVLAPRYLFVDVDLNGEQLGRMALEEHFSKELLESQGRREGVLLRYDESMAWSAYQWPGFVPEGVFNSFRLAPITPFRSGTVWRSPRLTAEYQLAASLLRGFALDTLPASAVFDTQLLGRYLAVSDIWNVWHSLRWHNQRFYFNPITTRLEPVAFDAMTAQPRDTAGPREPIVTQMLRDPFVRRSYAAALERIAAALKGSLGDSLAALQDELLTQLSWDYPLVRGHRMGQMASRVPSLLAALEAEPPPPWTPDSIVLPHHSRDFLQAFIVGSGTETVLETASTVPDPVTIEAVGWASEGDTIMVDTPLLPLAATGTEWGHAPIFSRLPVTAAPSDSAVLVVWATPLGRAPTKVGAQRYPAIATRRPVPDPSLAEVLKQHPFLRGVDDRWLQARPGHWRVAGSLILPSGYGLRLVPGTELEFEREAMLLVRGATEFRGTSADPIVLGPAASPNDSSTWQGLVVLGGGAGSSWRNVHVVRTSGVHQAGWSLPAGVTLHQSPTVIDSSIFQGTLAEDALNLIHSPFTVSHTSFRETASDAFDVDFSDGLLEYTSFGGVGRRGGGDALDISGATVEVRNSEFHDIGDKAISVGERSHLSASDIVITRASVGAVSKDGSHLIINGAEFRSIELAALMAYIKKPEYGPAEITASAVTFDDVTRSVWVQPGSNAVVNSLRATTESLNVDSLYQTAMRKGAAQ